MVSEDPDRDVIFPNGGPWGRTLATRPTSLIVPAAAVESFAGVANAWSWALAAGERVLDLGSGAEPAPISLIAAQMVGPEGRVTGIDMTPQMLAKARAAAVEMRLANGEFVEAERLPFPDARPRTPMSRTRSHPPHPQELARPGRIGRHPRERRRADPPQRPQPPGCSRSITVG